MRNILISTDVYKLGHMLQYKPGITKVYSYLTTRNDSEYKEMVWFGLEYYIKEYINKPIAIGQAREFIYYYEKILGTCPDEVKNKIIALEELGYWPLEIKALPEGRNYPTKTCLMTITNTLPEFYWCVGFLESLLLKVWFPSTVATYSQEYRNIAAQYIQETSSNVGFIDYMVHDFGYRGDSSEESAALSGAAHLLAFKGSDTIAALPFAEKYYPELGLQMVSVAASEHSVMCSFGREGELEAIRHMLKTYPTGIVSIVADTYNLWDFITVLLPQLKDDILARDGKVVIRPDSGDPVKIICGERSFGGQPRIIDHKNLPHIYGCLELLGGIFDYTINDKGFKELNPKVGLIYGDGMYLGRYEIMLETMAVWGWAASNLVIGVGGILRNHTRDTLGFALKTTYVEIEGAPMEVMKDPITDPGKKSHCGLIRVDENYITHDHQTWEEEQQGLLKTVYKK